MLEESRGGSDPECSKKTGLNHRLLWKKSPQEAPGALFSGPETLQTFGQTQEAVGGEGSSLIC